MPLTRREFVWNLSAISLVGATSRTSGRAEQEPLVSAKDAVDHLLLGVADREAGIRRVEERTGVRARGPRSEPRLAPAS